MSVVLWFLRWERNKETFRVLVHRRQKRTRVFAVLSIACSTRRARAEQSFDILILRYFVLQPVALFLVIESYFLLSWRRTKYFNLFYLLG